MQPVRARFARNAFRHRGGRPLGASFCVLSDMNQVLRFQGEPWSDGVILRSSVFLPRFGFSLLVSILHPITLITEGLGSVRSSRRGRREPWRSFGHSVDIC
jgi:hypothetical protein